MDPADYLRAVADAWGADPDTWAHYIETDRDTRNLLRDLADNIEQGTFYIS